MGKRHTYRIDRPTLAAEGTYEGKTVRLDPRAPERAGERSARAQRNGFCWGGFPWWALWLIWPAVLALKWLVMALPAITVSLPKLDKALSVPAAFLAVLLIIVGILLMRRG